MKRLYGENVINLLPVKDGFVFAVQQAAYDLSLIHILPNPVRNFFFY